MPEGWVTLYTKKRIADHFNWKDDSESLEKACAFLKEMAEALELYADEVPVYGDIPPGKTVFSAPYEGMTPNPAMLVLNKFKEWK